MFTVIMDWAFWILENISNNTLQQLLATHNLNLLEKRPRKWEVLNKFSHEKNEKN